MKSNAKCLMNLIASFVGMAEVANAFYDPGLQRWISRDPIGEVGAINLFEFVGSSPNDSVDAIGLFKVKGKTVSVDGCEIVIVYGHQDGNDPWKFQFPKDKPCAGGAVMCWPNKSNKDIPPKNQIPAPSHDDLVVWNEGTSGKARAEQELNPLPLGKTELKETIDKAKKKGQEMVDNDECKEVAIKFHRAGLGRLKDAGIPSLPNDIIIDKKTPAKPPTK